MEKAWQASTMHHRFLLSLLHHQSPTAPHGRRLYRSPLVKRERMPEVVQLPESTVQRMRGDAPVTTLEQVAAMRVEVEARKEHERAAARVRKEKMLRLEAEARTQVCELASWLADWLAGWLPH